MKPTRRTPRHGIFGSPSFVTEDGEMFWGDDRLEEAIAWASGRHTRKDMENSMRIVAHSEELRKGAEELAQRCLSLAGQLVASDAVPAAIVRGGRKAHRLIGGD